MERREPLCASCRHALIAHILGKHCAVLWCGCAAYTREIEEVRGA